MLGEELPAGLIALEARPRSEVLFRRALRPTLDLPVEIVLPSHGAPVLGGAESELSRVAAQYREGLNGGDP